LLGTVAQALAPDFLTSLTDVVLDVLLGEIEGHALVDPLQCDAQIVIVRGCWSSRIGEDALGCCAQQLRRIRVRGDLFEEADAVGSQGVVRSRWHRVLSIVA
jgi:hypothetical protein